MTSVLTILSTGHRATVEEQDDTAVWFAAMCAGDLEIDLLLTGSAVLYGVGSDAPPRLELAGRPAACPPHMSAEVARLIARGVDVAYVEEDASEYGLDSASFGAGLEPVPRREIAVLVDAHDLTWRF